MIGGGNIGLEFASLFATLGTEVTVFDAGKRLLPREEQDIATLAQEYLQAKNINFVFNANLTQVRNEGETVVITDNSQDYSFDAVLYATGRKPNVSSLNLEATDIKLTEKGAIQVNEYCETTVPNVFAVGDVNGGPQFTYISLDDFRIVLTI
ncbi:FAD-dependent oxidoreductase [Pelistega indica]|uniref:FAD-dependent oxidoreductase n=1 Tax=Pelistega TaxID=106146 RepID=UPI001C409A75|nr:FAD-dependent oxidoreductase [Pelistega indica]